MAVIEVDTNKNNDNSNTRKEFTYSEKEFLALFRALNPYYRGCLLGKMEDFLIEQNFPKDD